MEIVITSGAISEDIDTVRSVTNNATGELGCRIAEAFAHKYNDKIHITYLCERTAIRPHLTCVNVQFVHGIEQTIDTLHTILTTRSISAVIHSMAVSDYTVDNVTNTQLLAQNLFDKIHINPPLNLKEMELLLKDCIDQATFLNRKGKISSKMADMVLVLKKAPKIINMIKKYSPNTKLVGFKLLDNVSHDELIKVGNKLLNTNNCDFVLANDLQSIREKNHTGFLIKKDRTVEQAYGKTAIAEMIANNLAPVLT